ncbi:MAG: hypothetical protein JW751_14375 [Polyangiaceae bacterium]|nr:hypothetical protein [Polyangiaceae bacterium]
MRFATPWSSTPEHWSGYVPAPVEPGIDPPCGRLVRGVPPSVQRYYDLVLLPEAPVAIPERPNPAELSFLAAACRECRTAPPPSGAPPPSVVIVTPPSEPPWPWVLKKPVWGLYLLYEQAWFWEGSSLGELIESISLTPEEELEIEVFSWDRTKLGSDLETTDLVDKRGETSLTSHDSAQVTKRLEHERQWEFGANVGFSSGVTAGIDFNFSDGTSDFLERRREQRQERTSRAAQQMRSERKLHIATARESGVEEKRRRKLKNANPTRTVTYNFYETCSHHRVEIALAESRWIVGLPNELPVITPEWVACHAGILAQSLLDETHHAGLQAAQRLARRYPPDRIGRATQLLHREFNGQRKRLWPNPPGTLPSSEPRPWPEWDSAPPEPQPVIRNVGRFFAALFTAGLSELAFLGDQPTDPPADGEEPPSYAFIASYLEGAVQSPSITGLIGAMRLVTRWYTPWAYRGGYSAYPMSSAAEGALGFAHSVVVQTIGEFPDLSAEAPVSDDTTAATPSENAVRQAWLEGKEKQQALLDAIVTDEAAFRAFSCHVSENILHYMRPIWLAEDPGQRRGRLAAALLHGSPDGTILAGLIEEPLLGFHLNCSVFAIRLGTRLEAALRERLLSSTWSSEPLPVPDGLQVLAARLRETSGEMRKAVEHQFGEIAQERTCANARQILFDCVDEAVEHHLSCHSKRRLGTRGSPPRRLHIGDLPGIMRHATTQLDEMVESHSAHFELALSETEIALRARLLERLDTSSGATVEGPTVDRTMRAVWESGRLAEAIARGGDLKPIMITLPDGGYHCEPVLGHCSAVDKTRGRSLEAEVAKAEAGASLADLEAQRRRRLLETGVLTPEPLVPSIRVTVEKPEE